MSSAPVPRVEVRGEARFLVDAELADLGVTVTGRARDRQAALERCRVRQAEVVAVLAAVEGLESQETGGAWVHDEPGDHGATHAVASLHTRVVLGRLDAVGALLGALGRLQDVDVSGPTWRLRPDGPHVETARLAAVRDAVRRARQYAAAFGAELTALLEVRDAGLSGVGLRVAAETAAMAPFGADEFHLDLTPARQEVHGAVEVSFAMSAPDPEVFGR
jgi:uncharacterized protein YggE